MGFGADFVGALRRGAGQQGAALGGVGVAMAVDPSGVSATAGAVAGALLAPVADTLGAEAGALADPVALPDNHELLRAVRRARLTAIRTIVREAQREAGEATDASPVLASLAAWTERALARSLADLDPRTLARRAPLPPTPDERVPRILQGARRLRAAIRARLGGEEGEEGEIFTDADRLAVAWLEAFFVSESRLANGPADDAATALQAEDAALFSALATAAAFDEAACAVASGPDAIDWEVEPLATYRARFEDKQAGFFATFRVLVRNAAVSDEVFARKLPLFVAARTQAEVRALAGRMSHGIEAAQARLDAVLGALSGIRADLDRMLASDAGALLVRVADLLAESRRGTEALAAMVAPLTAGPILDPRLPEDDPRGHLGTGQKLRYSERLTAFVGRDAEREALLRFVSDAARLRWWQVAGEAGQGKSRIALDLVDLLRARGWHAGFLRPLEDDDQLRRITDWRPWRDTLLVADYVAAPERAKRLATVIETLRRTAAGEGPRLRLLVLERQPYDLAAPRDVATSAAWHAPLLAEEHGEAAKAARLAAFAARALVLADPADDDLRAVAQDYAQQTRGRGLDECEAQAVDVFLGLGEAARAEEEARPVGRRRARRPLFAMLAAEAALLGEAAEPGDSPFEQLLAIVLAADRRKLGLDPQAPPPEAAENLALLANMVGALPLKPFVDAPDAFYGSDPGSHDKAWRLLGRDVAPAAIAAAGALRAREPDLLAEYQVLAALKLGDLYDAPTRKRAERLIADAWRVDVEATWGFLNRLFEDFPRHSTTAALAGYVPVGDELTRYAWAVIAFNGVTLLAGCRHYASARVLYEALVVLTTAYNEPALREQQAKAAYNLIFDLRADDLLAARALYKGLSALAAAQDEPALRQLQAKAALNLTQNLQTADLPAALTLYSGLSELAARHNEPALREEQAKAAFNLLNGVLRTTDLPAARTLYDALSALAAAHDEPALREQQAKAAVNLTYHLFAADRQAARALYEELAALAAAHEQPTLRAMQAMAGFNLLQNLRTVDASAAKGVYEELVALDAEYDGDIFRDALRRACMALADTCAESDPDAAAAYRAEADRVVGRMSAEERAAFEIEVTQDDPDAAPPA